MKRIWHWIVCFFTGHKLINYRQSASGVYSFECERCRSTIYGWSRP